MFRFSNLTKKSMMLLTCAGLSLSGTANVYAAKDLTQICSENEYLLISTGNNYAEIYDNQGNCLGSCRTYLDGIYTANKSDYLSYYGSDSMCQIYSMAQLQNILALSSDEYDIQIEEGIFLVTNRYTGQCTLYGQDEQELYRIGEQEQTEGEYYGRLLVLDNGYLVGVCRNLADGSGESSLVEDPVWIEKQGQESRLVTDSYLKSCFVNWQTMAFGDNLFIYDWETESGTAYDLDGNVLLGQIVNYWYDYSGDDWSYNYIYNGMSGISLVFQMSDGFYKAYDTSLQECASFPASDEQYFGYNNGYIQGAAYPELGNRACAGFVNYKNQTWCPYATREDGDLVYADGELVLIPLSENESLSELNEKYILTSCYENDMSTEYLKDRETGEIITQSWWNDDGGRYLMLGEDYCLVTDMVYGQSEDEDTKTSITILDGGDHVSYSAENASATVWKDGLLSLKRGIYNGIADKNGEWLIKTIYSVEE